jgi:hypothetical protein
MLNGFRSWGTIPEGTVGPPGIAVDSQAASMVTFLRTEETKLLVYGVSMEDIIRRLSIAEPVEQSQINVSAAA